MDYSPPGSSVHGIFQARILEWVAISFSRGSSWSRDWTWVSCIACRFFAEPPGKPFFSVTKFHLETANPTFTLQTGLSDWIKMEVIYILFSGKQNTTKAYPEIKADERKIRERKEKSVWKWNFGSAAKAYRETQRFCSLGEEQMLGSFLCAKQWTWTTWEAVRLRLLSHRNDWVALKDLREAC